MNNKKLANPGFGAFGPNAVPYHTHNGVDAPSLTFTGLSDTPSSYQGQAGKVATVNATESGLDFSSGGTGSPGGSNKQIQFNNTGAFGGAIIDYNFSGGIVNLHVEDASVAGDGNDLVIQGSNENTSGDGGDITLVPGAGSGSTSTGGDVILEFQQPASSAQVGRLIMTNDTAGSSVYSHRLIGSLSTTTATPSTFRIYDTSGSTGNGPYFLEARIAAGRTSGTGGTAFDSAGYVIRATYKINGSGVPQLVGSIQQNYVVEDQVGWDATFVVSSNQVLLQVTGAANNNINWSFDILYVGPQPVY